ncbi:MAG TPA: gluconate 2-dehydrogenase subunit 3 family protein [Oceanospirillales bacterium]|nr:gluconate 2-dehydrogenase subunit 3 family protein [Oceanospirillales bacterium]
MKIYRNSKDRQQKANIIRFKEHWSHGINRRDFIKSSLVVSVLGGMTACKPSVPAPSADQELNLIQQSNDIVKIDDYTFSDKQHLDLQAIYMRLFPDDGDGPSADDLNILTYLEWAMTDQRNIDDGDPEFIVKGIGWLNQLANDEEGEDFRHLSATVQDELISQTANSNAGNNWLSILLYYMIEALTLDPFYGGNTKQIGWQWLEHQGGFPHPVMGKTYRDFE